MPRGVKRRRRKKTNRPSLYFHSGTHDAIVVYQQTDEDDKKEEIYVADILPAFNKLVENLIFMHGFAKIHGSYEDLKSDCVSFLYESIHKFDPNRGSKAFSYFNVIAKNWLIIMSKKKIKSNRRHVSMEDIISLSPSDVTMIENYQIAPSPGDAINKQETVDDIFSMMKEIREKLSGENEILCMNAIITLFEKIEDLELLNKRALFVYLRDISNLNPKQLSISLSVIRKHYREIVKNGDFDIFF
jgi:hypothetical protein